MNAPPPPVEPAVTVVDITDPSAAGAGIELIDLNAMQLQKIPLRARRVIVRLESAAVVVHSTNRRVRTRTRVLEGRLATHLLADQLRPDLEPQALALLVHKAVDDQLLDGATFADQFDPKAGA